MRYIVVSIAAAVALLSAGPASAAVTPTKRQCQSLRGRPDGGHQGGHRARQGRPARVRHAGQAGREPGADHGQLRAEGGVPAARAVLPHRAKGRPNVVLFDENAGLLAGASGPRGAKARRIAANPGADAKCRGQAFPCRTLNLLGELGTAYARERRFYALAPEGPGQALDAVRAGHRHHRPHVHARVLRRGAPARALHRGGQHAGAVPPDPLEGRDPRAARAGHEAEVRLPGHQRQGLQRGVHLGPAQRAPRRSRRACATWWPATARCR